MSDEMEAVCSTPQRCAATRECCGCGERDLVPPEPGNVMYFGPAIARR